MAKKEFDYCLTTQTDPCGTELKCKSLIEAYTENFVNPPASDTYGSNPSSWWGQQGSPPGWFSTPDGICIQPDYDKTTNPPLSGRQYLNGKFLTTRYPLNDIVNGDPTNETKNALRGAIPIDIGCEQRICGAASKEIPSDTYKLIDILEPSNLRNVYNWNEAPWATSGARKVSQGFATLGGTIVLRWPDEKVRTTLFGGNPLWKQMVYFAESSPGVEAGYRAIDEDWQFDRWVIDSKAIPMLQYYNPTIDFSPNSPDLKKFVLNLRIGARTEEELRDITTEPYTKLDGSVVYIYRPFKILPKFKYPERSTPTNTSSGNGGAGGGAAGGTGGGAGGGAAGGTGGGAGGGRGVAGKMNAEFESIEQFASTLASAVKEDIDTATTPLKNEIQQLRTLLQEVADVANGAAAAAGSAQLSADAAARAADAAKSTADKAYEDANRPPPTPSTTPTPIPSSEVPPVSGGGGATPTPTPTPVVSSGTPPVLPKDKLIGVSVEPLAATATIGQITGAGLYATGDTATLRFASAPTGYTFDGWYNSAGQQVSTSEQYTFTVQSSESFTIKFSIVSDPRVNVTLKWAGSSDGARNEDGKLLKRLRIGTNPGNVTQKQEDVERGTRGGSITVKVLPGTQLVLNARNIGVYGGNFGVSPDWYIENPNVPGTAFGMPRLKDSDFEYRPTVPQNDITFIAAFGSTSI